MSSKITSLTIVYSTVYSGADRRKHQSSASRAFVSRIRRRPVNSPHKRPVTQKMFSIWRRHLDPDTITLNIQMPIHVQRFCNSRFQEKYLLLQRNYRQINSRFLCSAVENCSHISPHKYSPFRQASSGGQVVVFCPLVLILPRDSYHGPGVHARDVIQLYGPAREALRVTWNDKDSPVISMHIPIYRHLL